MDPKVLTENFNRFIEFCLNEAEGVVYDFEFEMVGQAPYFKEITKPEGRPLTKEEFLQMFTVKISVFFNTCETVRATFLKNRRFRSISQIYSSNIPGLFIGVFKTKLVYLSKFISDKPNPSKHDLVKSKFFSIFGDQNPNILKIIGWHKHEKCLYFVHEYIDLTLGFYIQANSLNHKDIEMLTNEIISTVKYLNETKKLFFTKSSILVRGSSPVFPIIPSTNQDLEFQNKHLSTAIEHLPSELKDEVYQEIIFKTSK